MATKAAPTVKMTVIISSFIFTFLNNGLWGQYTAHVLYIQSLFCFLGVISVSDAS